MPERFTPDHCRRPAFDLFSAQLRRLDAPECLLRAAIAISMHELDAVEPNAVEAEIQGIADAIRARLRSDDPQAILAHAHGVLFDEMGFRGDERDYYHPRNSYVPAVLERRRGLPITLTLIYKSVLERLGLRVHGIAAPAHFIAAVEAGPGAPTLIDPFFRGRAVNPDEAARRAEQVLGQQVDDPHAVLPRATHRDWIMRMLQNLQGSFARAGRTEDLAAMLELRAIL
jgi:regulator of sirC expression with transglutaminase-like and TPR domain